MSESCEKFPDSHHDIYSKTVFGFWLYLITDFMLFATMFAAFVVLRENFFGGPTPKEMFNLTANYWESYTLLTASFSAGIAGAMLHRRKAFPTVVFFILTSLLGVVFCVLEYQELHGLVIAGLDWTQSAYLSCFFSIVGTFFVHVVIAVLWTVVLLAIFFVRGLDAAAMRRLTCLRMFWQFLTIIWVFIFSAIYLMGVI